jgi:agmatinase
VSPFAQAQVADAGDAGPDPIDIGTAHAAIQAAAGDLHAAGARVLGLGGDHSVALPFMRAAAERHGTLSLLQLDAHTDTWDEYYGHKVTHGTIMRRAAEEGVIDPGASLQVGLRGPLYRPSDLRENAELGFSTLLAREFTVEEALARASSVLRAPVYVSFDIDCLDPAYAPGTGTPEAGGLTSREALAVLRGLAGLDIVSADLVEVSPPYDPTGVTANAAAAIAYDLISLMTRPPPA